VDGGHCAAQQLSGLDCHGRVPSSSPFVLKRLVNGASTSPHRAISSKGLLDASRFESHSIKILLLSRDHFIEAFLRVQVERGLTLPGSA
jgi:hypothetical protein